MPTYNRATETPRLLQEAVGSFLAQDCHTGRPKDRHDAHLLIGNDTPGQGLQCDHPRVHVLNYRERFRGLGAKLQAMAEYATEDMAAEALCRWDDDDYNLAHRLSTSAAMLTTPALAREDDSQQQLRLEWRPTNYWWHRRGLPGEVWEVERPGNTHCMAIWRPAVLGIIGGYPDTTGDEDQQFNSQLARHAITAAPGWGRLPADRIFYVYRWGVSPRHLSGAGGRRGELDAQYEKIGRRDITKGIFEIRPRQWELPAKRLTLEERPDRQPQ